MTTNMVSSPFPRFNPQTGQLEMIDPTSGQAIPNYNIVPSWQQVKLEDYGLGLGQTPQDSPITPDTPEQAVSEQREQQGFTRNLEGGDRGNTPTGNYHRDPSNNFGYFDKPAGMGFASNLPGALGIAGKGINAVVNANNVGAIDAARGMMGISGLSTKDVLSGIAKDKQGFVANVDITNQAGKTNPYSVSLEAMTPSGKTALTPDEARKRSAANPANITLSAKQDESKKGIFSGVKSFIDNLFSSPENTKQVESKAFGTMTVASPKSGGVYDVFPDAPAAVGKANGESQGGRGRGGYAAGGNSTPAGGLGQESSGGRGRGGYAAGGNSTPAGGLGQESQGGRGRGGYAAGGNSNTSAGGKSSGAADKDTSSYGGAKDSGDAQSSGRSGGLY